MRCKKCKTKIKQKNLVKINRLYEFDNGTEKRIDRFYCTCGEMIKDWVERVRVA